MRPPWRQPIPTRVTEGATQVYVSFVDAISCHDGDEIILAGTRAYLVPARWRWLEAGWQWVRHSVLREA